MFHFSIYPNANTNTEIQKYKYRNANTEMQIQKYRNAKTEIQIQEYRNTKTVIQIKKYRNTKREKPNVGSLSAEVLLHGRARARNATVSQIPQLNTAATAWVLERAEQTQIQIQMQMQIQMRM